MPPRLLASLYSHTRTAAAAAAAAESLIEGVCLLKNGVLEVGRDLTG
jgi:hypothetical protein